MLRDIADVRFAHFERRWQIAAAWAVGGLSVAWYAFLVLRRFTSVGLIVSYHWFALLVRAAAVAVLWWTARRHYLAVRVAGHGRAWILRHHPDAAPEVGAFAAALGAALAARASGPE